MCERSSAELSATDVLAVANDAISRIVNMRAAMKETAVAKAMQPRFSFWNGGVQRTREEATAYVEAQGFDANWKFACWGTLATAKRLYKLAHAKLATPGGDVMMRVTAEDWDDISEWKRS